MNKLITPKGRRLPNAPYIITEYGKIFSLLSMRYLKPDHRGQVYLHLRDKSNSVEPGRKFYVKRLTAQMYVPNPSNHPIVLSKQNTKGETIKSGHYTSLRWSTHKDADH